MLNNINGLTQPPPMTGFDPPHRPQIEGTDPSVWILHIKTFFRPSFANLSPVSNNQISCSKTIKFEQQDTTP
jgi:hypothetical protein